MHTKTMIAAAGALLLLAMSGCGREPKLSAGITGGADGPGSIFPASEYGSGQEDAGSAAQNTESPAAEKSDEKAYAKNEKPAAGTEKTATGVAGSTAAAAGGEKTATEAAGSTAAAADAGKTESAALSEEKPAAWQQISQEEAKRLMDSEKSYVIIDAREQNEYDEGHIAGAVLMPYTQAEELAEKLLPDKAQLILIYCRSGRRSKIAAQTLADMGYTDVREFGGIIDWPYGTVK